MSDRCLQKVWFDGGPWNKEYHEWPAPLPPRVHVMWIRPPSPIVQEDSEPLDGRYMPASYATYELRQRCPVVFGLEGACYWLAECVENCDGPKD